MLAVVAEKTGYPAEMLGMHMELEGDLGIDSIKRVEILSTMKERAPGLPEVDAAEMGALRTLGEIVASMRKASGAAPQAAQVVEAPASPDGIARYAVGEVPAPAVGLASALPAGRLVVTDDEQGVAGQVVRRLGERGLIAEVVREVPADAVGVVFLGGLRAVRDEAAAIAVNREAFAAARAVAAKLSASEGLFVTVQDTGGDFGLSGRDPKRAWLAGIAGLARTAAIEWPNAACKAIDLEVAGRDAGVVADAIVAEILDGGPLREVGLHADGRRTTLRAIAMPIARSGGAKVGPTDVIVATGGGRGVTAACLVELARASKPRFAILGRTPLADEPAACAGAADDATLKRALLSDAQKSGKKVSPAEIGAQVAKIVANREIRATLAAIEAAGGKATYLAADVQDGAALSAALDGVRRTWGPITGVVHGAGVLADKKIAEKTQEQFDRVFDTKVAGLRGLLAATASDPLRFVVLFSSVAARTGNNGQCDYAMANEVLNKVGWALHAAKGIPVKAIGWGPWEGGMVTPALAKHFAGMGVALIPLATGARMFVDEIVGSPDQVETVVGGELGEGALGAYSEPTVDLQVDVSRRSHPFLADHAIGGKPVVPVALALEWMLRGARACRPDLAVAALRDIKVMRGIKLENFDFAGDRLRVVARQLANGNGATLAVAIEPTDGKPAYYTATCEMVDHAPTAPRPPAAARLGAWDAAADVYDGHLLFHGPAFHAIRGIEGISAEGVVGTLDGARTHAWPAGPWHTDPLVVDGALQLALVWGRVALGGASLPMAVAAFHPYGFGLADGPVRALITSRAVHASRAIADIALVGADGRVVAELRGVEVVLRPGEKPETAHSARA
jgi:hypothetical protein